MTEKQSEALERLNQGIQESRQEVQRRTMSLAKDYFDGSAEELKQQIQENRSTLEGLPDQIPGGREDAFQTMFQELMDNYSSMEEAINEAQQNVANLDTDRIRRQGEVDATDAARRQAKELGVDLTEVEGTGAAGRIIVPDVVEAAERMDAGDGEEAETAETGAAEGTAEQAQEQAGQAVEGAQDAAGGAADQAQQVAGQAARQGQQATDQAQQQVGQATDQAGQATQDVQDAVGGLAGNGQGGGGGPLGGIADQAGQVTGQVQDAAGQATDQAGQAAQQAQGAAGQTAGQAQQTADQAQDTVGYAPEQQAGEEDESGEPKATNAARRKAQELGVDLFEVQGSGYGGLITIKDVVGS